MKLRGITPLDGLPIAVKLKKSGVKFMRHKECLIRNLMALELCHYPSKTYICDYIHLMDSLINTENDVDLLSEKGISHNPSGDNSVTANMFNKLRLQIPPSQDSFYFTIYKDMRYHYNNRWNHAMETLNSMYFSNPWRGTATVVAIILL
ncbi:hypothetical protein Patl1_12016 [Pistacia atlantica]|uniref:Uncharacterized protein n=1 Tax=Pistacia atlantica TaxID=434234 RepID=A0ACC1A4T3_9ROSI|nr:hypothetical protein Patl1_12016 [Pistacia atlantica]